MKHESHAASTAAHAATGDTIAATHVATEGTATHIATEGTAAHAEAHVDAKPAGHPAAASGHPAAASSAANSANNATGAATGTAAAAPKQRKQNFGAMMAIYLTGLFVGGLYVGMIIPARTLIQLDFGIDDSAGIWMINIYTLFYAALIPVIGKLADRNGRKTVLMVCIVLFAAGLTLCGISALTSNFALLLAGRVVQAVGACGMIPIANAEMGTAFPPEKRGMALGMAASVAGISNIVGAAAGSAILGICGVHNWGWLFFWCLPVCLLLLLGAAKFLPNNTHEAKGRLDLVGAAIFVALICALLLALKSLDFFNLASAANIEVWGMGLAAVAFGVIFALIERRADDPIFHLEYFRSLPIVITMAVSFFIGAMIISMTIISQFAEFLLNIPAGSGGYYVAVIGIFSIAGPMIAGRLMDKIGPKPVLLSGLVVAMGGFLFLAFITTAYPSVVTMLIGLAIVGAGMGFAMGAPTNYMILENVPVEESTAAISTIALVRQIGTTLAPAIFVGFVTANANILGYQQMMICVAICCAIGAALMLLYKSPKK